jgi:hypothetical protein
MLAMALDKRGMSWYVSGLIWFGIGLPITLWAYVVARSNLEQAVGRFESALRQNSACTIRIQSERMVEFEEEEDEGACYAFQLSGGRIVFVSGQQFYSSLRFPNSDFSLVEIQSGEGMPMISLIEKEGHRIQPMQTIPANRKAALEIPSHLQVIHGDISQIEQLLSQQ